MTVIPAPPVQVRAASRRRIGVRSLHPGAWWLWALALAAAAGRTTNPLLLGLVIAVAALVVSARGSDAPWGRSFAAFCRLGLFVVGLRLVFEVLFGTAAGGSVLFSLPEVPLPEWAAGVRIGGAVTSGALVAALYDGLRLFAVLACIGAANSLADPRRLLKTVPSALYEVGVALVVALSITPALVIELDEVREARRLRGRTDRGLAGLAGSALPVLAAALDRAVALAAAMDARGFGRMGNVSARSRRVSAALTATGLIGALIGTYALLDAASPVLLGLPVLLLGVAAATAGIGVANSRGARSRYRPDPWRAAEWAVVACGATAAVVLALAAARGVPGLAPATSPPAWPSLPWGPALAICVAALPAWLAPAPARSGSAVPR